jgi:hypothetical protein
MRQLLMDAMPLVDQINQTHRIRLQFHVGLPGLAIDEHTLLFAMLDGIDPQTARAKRTELMARDQFLAATVLVANGRIFTVRDIILFEANVMGGVHAGALKTEQEQALNSIANALHQNDLRATLAELKAIGRVVLRGLAPLKAAVEGKGV